jgi:hypothetical protein
MSVGYIPSLTPGQPGRAALSTSSSLGLLRHIKAHADQDRETDWAGLRGFCGGDRIGRQEAAALDGELAAAGDLGRPEVVALYQDRKDRALAAPAASPDANAGSGFFDADPEFDGAELKELAERVADPAAAVGDRARSLAALARHGASGASGTPDADAVVGFLESAARNVALRQTPVLDCVSLGWVAMAAGLFATRGRPEAQRFAAVLEHWPAVEQDDLQWFLASQPGLL